jgi:hypothetical protein
MQIHKNFEPKSADILSPHMRAIFEHWLTSLRDRIAPNITDFGPLNLPPASLAYVILCDLEFEPFRMKYRLVGAHGVWAAGMDFTSKFLDELEMPEQAAQLVLENMRWVAEHKRPMIGAYDWPILDGEGRTDVEFINLPLLKDGAVAPF